VFFPITGVNIAVWYLVGIGFAVGMCGGFWGGGGGWILTPALYAVGVPMNIAVGTSLAQMVGQAIVATFWHHRLGNISVRVAAMMIPGTIVGVEIGARIMEVLKTHGEAHVNQVISVLYIILLSGLAIYTLVESLCSQQALARAHQQQTDDEKTPSNQRSAVADRVLVDAAHYLAQCRIPPMIRCPLLRVERMSFWVIFLAAMLTGILAGLLGVGGGFLRVPTLVYLIGCPTHVAVGTSMFAIIVSGAFGAFTHALKGNVDLLIALCMLIGAAIGAQIGSFATRYVQGTQLRVMFGVALVVATASIVVKNFFNMPVLAIMLVAGIAGLMTLIIITLLIRGVAQAARAQAEQAAADH